MVWMTLLWLVSDSFTAFLWNVVLLSASFVGICVVGYLVLVFFAMVGVVLKDIDKRPNRPWPHA